MGATSCVQLRVSAFSQAAVHAEKLPSHATFAGHVPSPGWQSTALCWTVGHTTPFPDGATVCAHVRVGAFSHAAVQPDQLPSQLTSAGAAGHASMPAEQSGAAVGHATPVPDGATVCVHVRTGPFSHAAVQADQLPSHATFGMATGQAPSPPLQSGACAGHGAPVPDGAAVCVHVLTALFSHAAVHAVQVPAQATFAGTVF